jgi:hypothetical protein
LKFLIIIFTILFSFNIFPQQSAFNCPNYVWPIPESCIKRNKELENYVLNLITLNWTNSVRDITIGTYVTADEWHECEHHFVAYYTRDKHDDGPQEIGPPNYREKVNIFRYFHFNNHNMAMVPPPEIMIARKTPLNWDPPPNIKNREGTTRVIEPSYKCEQRFEKEFQVAMEIRNYCPKSFMVPEMASLVIPKEEYPLCEYHVFGMYYTENYEVNPDPEIEFVHYVFNENGFSDYYGYLLQYPKRFKGRKVEIPHPNPPPLKKDGGK